MRSRALNSLLGTLCVVAASSLAGVRPLGAQVSEGGLPSSFHKAAGTSFETVTLAGVDVEALRAEDAREAEQGKLVPARFGFGFDVSLGLENAGTWEDAPDGGRIWRLRIECPGAHSINLLYDQFMMPEGARFFVYSEDRRTVLGAFTAANNRDHGMFATAPTAGSACIAEYDEPAPARGRGRLSIARVVHGYREIFRRTRKDFGEAGICQVNVNCPEGAAWLDQVNSVGMILCGGGLRCCSGAMINNVRRDGTPYFLTARHCTEGEDMRTWVILFNYQSPDCSIRDGPTDNSVTGAVIRASNVSSDFALLELEETPPARYNVYYAGWSRSDTTPDESTIIHHPEGDIKKISVENDAATTALWNGALCWQYRKWDLGATEVGSSGAPIFNKDHRIVGQFFGGISSCPRAGLGPDYAGRFDVSWNRGATQQTRLRDWLDPGNTSPMTLDGYYPFKPPSIAITSPAADAVVFGIVDIAVTASADDGIAKVEFFIDNVLAATDTTEPYVHSWDTAGTPLGPHSIRATATSNSGVSASQAIAVTVSEDCNGNLVADLEDLRAGTSRDCNHNGVPDECDISRGTATDCNANGVPDACDLLPSDFGTEQLPPYAAGDGPVSIAAADFNGDGALDLVAANRDAGTVSLFIKKTDDTFADAVSIPAAPKPTCVVAGDFDGDAKTDLAVAAEGGRDNVLVLIGNGDGTFTKTFKLTVGTDPRWLAAADLDGDRDLDLAVACEPSQEIRVLLNFGNAAFSQDFFSVEGSPFWVTAADLDGDGDLDLAYIVRDAKHVTRVRGAGNGTFTEPVDIALGDAGATPKSLAAADLDGDGDIDLAVANETADGVTLLLNKGDATFNEPKLVPCDDGPIYVVAADVNYDEDPDLVVLDVVATGNGSQGSISVLVNKGNATFEEQPPIEVSDDPRALVVAQFVGSGAPDIAFVDFDDDEVSVLRNATQPAKSMDCNVNGKPDECDIAGGTPDCNKNGVPDSCDIARGTVPDENGNGIPDPCEGGPKQFLRGETNEDGKVNIADVIFTLGYLFTKGAPAPSCLKAADANDDGRVNVADAIAILGHLFGGVLTLPAPFGACGTDPTDDEVTCEAYKHCP